MAENVCYENCPFFSPETHWIEPLGPNGEMAGMGEPPTCKYDNEPYSDTWPGKPCEHKCGLRLKQGETTGYVAENVHLAEIDAVLEAQHRSPHHIMRAYGETKKMPFEKGDCITTWLERNFARMPRYSNVNRATAPGDGLRIDCESTTVFEGVIIAISFTTAGPILVCREHWDNEDKSEFLYQPEACEYVYLAPVLSKDGIAVYESDTLYDDEGNAYSVASVYRTDPAVRIVDENGDDRIVDAASLYHHRYVVDRDGVSCSVKDRVWTVEGDPCEIEDVLPDGRIDCRTWRQSDDEHLILDPKNVIHYEPLRDRDRVPLITQEVIWDIAGRKFTIVRIDAGTDTVFGVTERMPDLEVPLDPANLTHEMPESFRKIYDEMEDILRRGGIPDPTLMERFAKCIEDHERSCEIPRY